VQRWNLERKLVGGVLVLFLLPTVLLGAVLIALYHRGILDDPADLAIAVSLALMAMLVYLALVAHGIGRLLVRTVQDIQRGAELMATVNPDHRLEIRTGDELEALADEVNRMADRLRDARQGLETQVGQTTRELDLERRKLAAVLVGLDEGVVVAGLDGMVTLCNPRAQELLGAAPHGVLGRSLFDFVDREKVEHFLGKIGPGQERAERFTLHPAGGMVLDAGMTAFADAEGRVTGFIMALRDVSRAVGVAEGQRQALTDGLREVRGALSSIRSLSESLLGGGMAEPSAPRLLAAIHAEAIRLSERVAALEEPGGVGLAGPAWQFEELGVADLLGLARRRLLAEGMDQSDLAVEVSAPLPGIRAEGSALSAALAHLARHLLVRRRPVGAVTLGAVQRGSVIEVEAAAPGRAAFSEMEAVLDSRLWAGMAVGLSVREIVGRHAGETWAFAEEARMGFRLSLPMSAPASSDEPPRGRRPVLVGAGLESGWAGAPASPGHEKEDFYDFSLMERMERHVPPADRARSLEELTFVVLDTETTGLQPDQGDQVVSIAGVRVRGGVARRGETFDALVNPRRGIPPASSRFHGITEARVATAPPLDVVLLAFLEFVESSVLVGHEVWFDLRFLDRECTRLGLPSLSGSRPVLDSRLLSVAVHGHAPAHDLDAVAARLGVTIVGRHSALGDALATAEVFVRLLALLRKRGVRTLGEALEACRGARPVSSPGDGAEGAR
jgi:DNA polymerase III subunit epsilon